MMQKSQIKVLVIRFSSIGDIILCSPVLRCLKKIKDVQVETHLLTKKNFLSFTSNYPYVDKVITLDTNLSKVINELKKNDYDFIVDLHNNPRSFRVKSALGKPSKAFDKLNIQKWLLTNFKINRMPSVHIVDRLMEAAKPLGAKYDGLGLDYFIPEKDKVELGNLPPVFQNGFTGFVIGGTYATKRLPAAKIVEICNQLQSPVILLGGPEDKEAGEWIASQAGEKVFNACGKFSLNASASLVEQASVVISHDTGLMHVAAAFSKPLASIWGNTVPELGMHPFFPDDYKAENSRIFEIKDLYCRPCSKIGYNKCPKKHFRCMNEISAQEVGAWVNDRLEH